MKALHETRIGFIRLSYLLLSMLLTIAGTSVFIISFLIPMPTVVRVVAAILGVLGLAILFLLGLLIAGFFYIEHVQRVHEAKMKFARNS